jgi:TetR/AcrR family transcriptional regulator, transcriptional repressor for nem operon
MGRVSDARERLLKATVELIWRESYGCVTVDAICERAGVKKGSFYYFFDSKSQLTAEALKNHWESLRPRYDVIFSASVPPLERFRRYFDFLYERHSELKSSAGRVLGCPFFTVGSEVTKQDPVIGEAVREIIKSKTKYFESALRDAQAEGLVHVSNIPAQAQALFAYVDGVLGQARIQNDLELIRTIPEGARRFLALEPAAV